VVTMKSDSLRTRHLFRMLLLAVGGLIAGVFSLTSALQPALAGHATLGLSPTPLLMSPGANGVLDVWVFGLDDSKQLAGYEIALDYDPSVIIVDGVAGGGARFEAIPVFTIDNENGRVFLTAGQIQVGAIEDALIARIMVRAVGALDASSDLTISSAELIDRARRRIAVTPMSNGRAAISNAAVMVGTAAVPQGSSTTVPVAVVFAPKGGLAGYNISVRYDPSIIAIDGISPGESPFAGTPIFSLNEEQSFVNIVGFHGERPGPVGRTVVLKIQVTGIKKGSSRLEVTVKDLVDAVDTASWPAVAVDGLVRVLSKSARGPGQSKPAIVIPAIAVDGPSALEGAIIADLAPNASTVISLPESDVTLTIPAGAVTEAGFVAIRPFDSRSGFPAPPSLDLGTTVEVNFLDLEGSLLDDVFLLKQAVLKMGVSKTDLETTGRDGILIQRYEPLLGRWLSLTTTIDKVELVASATTQRFSVFGLTFEQTASGGGLEGSDVQSSQDESATPPAVINSNPSEGSGAPGELADKGVLLRNVAMVLLVGVGALVGIGYLLRRNKLANSA